MKTACKTKVHVYIGSNTHLSLYENGQTFIIQKFNLTFCYIPKQEKCGPEQHYHQSLFWETLSYLLIALNTINMSGWLNIVFNITLENPAVIREQHHWQ